MCTNFKTKAAKDGTVVVGRTLEFPNVMPTELVVLPDDYAGTCSSSKGKTWTSRFGVVGMNVFNNSQWLIDGMNTEGLSSHYLYMPGHCVYAEPHGTGSDLSQMDLIAYLLGTCANVKEVRQKVSELNIFGIDPGLGLIPPGHFFCHDEQESIVIEFKTTGVSIVDVPTGVGTNAPYMEWHLTNINNYVGLGSHNPDALSIDGLELSPEGAGAGWRGLPGDLTPPSRLLRALAMVSSADPCDTGAETEMLALHILNNFDIPAGMIREPLPDGSMIESVTTWSSIANLHQSRYAYRAIDDPTVYVVDLATTKFDQVKKIPFPKTGSFTQVTI